MELSHKNKATLYATATEEFYCDTCDAPSRVKCMGIEPCKSRISKCLDVYGTDHFQEDWINNWTDTNPY